jgi:sigma-B regulation protein RsbU (phosphoserine phosphatase)
VTEGRRGDEQYGDDRLRTCLLRGEGSAQQRAEAVLEDAVGFQLGSPRDDVAVLVMSVPGQPGPPVGTRAH